MVVLSVDDRYVTVSANFQTRQVIRDCIKARPDGYQFMQSYKDGRWDGYISLFQRNKFPAGLLPVVEAELKSKDIPFEVSRKLTNSIPEVASVDGYELRNYQRSAVEAALTNQRGVLHMATNAGKTLVAASIIKATGSKAIVIVPTRALLLQTADKLEEMLHITVGRVGAGYMQDENVIVCTMASLDKVTQLDLGGNRTVICDETHHLRASSIFDNIFDIPGPYRIGMSGTPLTHDALSDLKLIGATGPIIYQILNSELIDDGWSVKPIIYFHTINTPDRYSMKWQAAYRDCIVNNDTRNGEIIWLAANESERGPVLILTNWIEHADEIANRMMNAVKLTGNNSKEEIIQALDLMRAGKLAILVATDIFGEGVDIPSVATVIMAAGGKSHIKLLQRVGRGLRTASGKSELHVHDFIDDTNKYLLRHSEQRHAVYNIAEGFDVRLVKDDEN